MSKGKSPEPERTDDRWGNRNRRNKPRPSEKGGPSQEIGSSPAASHDTPDQAASSAPLGGAPSPPPMMLLDYLGDCPEAKLDEKADVLPLLEETHRHDRAGARAAYHLGRVLRAQRKDLKQGEAKEWTEKKATELGVAPRTVRLYLQVEKALNPEALGKLATALPISILDRPLREIPQAIKNAKADQPYDADPERKERTPEEKSEAWHKRAQKLLADGIELGVSLREFAKEVLRKAKEVPPPAPTIAPQQSDDAASSSAATESAQRRSLVRTPSTTNESTTKRSRSPNPGATAEDVTPTKASARTAGEVDDEIAEKGRVPNPDRMKLRTCFLCHGLFPKEQIEVVGKNKTRVCPDCKSKAALD